jgi:hypothetical protein
VAGARSKVRFLTLLGHCELLVAAPAKAPLPITQPQNKVLDSSQGVRSADLPKQTPASLTINPERSGDGRFMMLFAARRSLVAFPPY